MNYPGTLSYAGAAWHRIYSWELSILHAITPILHERTYFKERGQPSARL